MEFLLVAINIFFIILFIAWAINTDKNLKILDDKIDLLLSNIEKRENSGEQKLLEPSDQMIAENGCDGDCKKCAGKNLCWQNRLNGDNKI